VTPGLQVSLRPPFGDYEPETKNLFQPVPPGFTWGA